MSAFKSVRSVHLSERSIELLVMNNDGKPPRRVRTGCYLHTPQERLEWVHELVDSTAPYRYNLTLQEVPYRQKMKELEEERVVE